MSMDYERLQQRIGYQFSNRRLLIQALTHKSYGHEYLRSQPVAHRDNERLEFLGDAVLDVVISDILLEAFPQGPEGQLSKMRAALVNERTLAEISKTFGLPEFLRLGRGEKLTGGNEKASILASTFEALVAAVYLDGGFQAIYPVVRFLFKPLIQDEIFFQQTQDHKTHLQEIVQAKWRVVPDYLLMNTTGPDHAKEFEVEVRVRSKTLAMARGSSKKDAEQRAARLALEMLNQAPPSNDPGLDS